MSQIIKVGDTINWSGGFGRQAAKKAIILSISLCEKGEKYGTPVDFIDVAQKYKCTFDLDNGHWAYGDQISQIP